MSNWLHGDLTAHAVSTRLGGGPVWAAAKTIVDIRAFPQNRPDVTALFAAHEVVVTAASGALIAACTSVENVVAGTAIEFVVPSIPRRVSLSAPPNR